MKTFSSLVLSFLFIFFFSNLSAQNILVVDNNPTAPSGTHVYSTIQAAINAAVDDDIIHIIPSPTNYGSASLSKRLNIYGIGYTPDTETGYTSALSYMTIDGSADGSLISGIVFSAYTSIYFNGNTNLWTCTIESCWLKSIEDSGSGTVNNVTIKNNIITSSYIGAEYAVPIKLSTVLGATSGIVITNNIICAEIYGSYNRGLIQAGNFTVITNNLFNGTGESQYHGFRILTDCIVTNNIFNGISTGSYGTNPFYNNTFVNNISYNAADMTFPPVGYNGTNGGSGNMENIDPEMTSVVNTLHWDITNNPELLPTSPAILAGSDGFDIGLSGGTYPFSFYGHGTPLPYIHILENAGLVIEGQDLNVTATARSHQ